MKTKLSLMRMKESRMTDSNSHSKIQIKLHQNQIHSFVHYFHCPGEVRHPRSETVPPQPVSVRDCSVNCQQKCYLLGGDWLFVTQWTLAHQVPQSMGFSRQEYWCGLPCPLTGDLPNPRDNPLSLPKYGPQKCKAWDSSGYQASWWRELSFLDAPLPFPPC